MGGFESERLMFGGVIFRDGDFRKGNAVGGIEQAEAKTGGQRVGEGAIEFFFGEQIFLDGTFQGVEFAAAANIASCFDGRRGGFLGRGDEVMVGVDVIDRATVGNDIAGEAPLVAEQVGEEERIGARGFAEDGIVSTHETANVTLFHGHFEMRQVGFVEIALGGFDVEFMALGLGAAVDGEMFRTGNGFEIVRIIALNAANEGHADLAGQKSIFTVGFLAAAPAWVAEDINIRRPVGEADVFGAVALVFAGVIVELGAAFGGNDLAFVENQIRVPRGGHADGLGKYRGNSVASDAVEGFVPIIVFGDAEARDGRSVIAELLDFFGERHPADEVFDAGVRGLGRIFPDFRAICGSG